MSDDQQTLWGLVYKTLKPKATDASPNACLNRLTNERLSGVPCVYLNEKTAVVRRAHWSTEGLSALDRKHKRMHDFEDDRPIVVVEYRGRKILIDGNHRVTRWLTTHAVKRHEVLLITPRDDNDS